MQPVETITANSARAIVMTVHYVEWHGKQIALQSEWPDVMCPPDQHQVEVMHHLGNPDGRHYCPTGFIWCLLCGAIGDEPEPHECTKWGED